MLLNDVGEVPECPGFDRTLRFRRELEVAFAVVGLEAHCSKDIKPGYSARSPELYYQVFIVLCGARTLVYWIQTGCADQHCGARLWGRMPSCLGVGSRLIKPAGCHPAPLTPNSTDFGKLHILREWANGFLESVQRRTSVRRLEAFTTVRGPEPDFAAGSRRCLSAPPCPKVVTL